MNFLAHAFLSFGNAELLAGNMISDFVKGNAQYSYSAGIHKGILLHRSIDDFTDSHPSTQKAKQWFRPAYRLYSGAIVDVLYDHFLATDERFFTEETLKEFTLNTYEALEKLAPQLPASFNQVFVYMKAENWLYRYRTTGGMKSSLNGLARRAAYINESDTAYNLFIDHYVPLKNIYEAFFSDLYAFAYKRSQDLLA